MKTAGKIDLPPEMLKSMRKWILNQVALSLVKELSPLSDSGPWFQVKKYWNSKIKTPRVENKTKVSLNLKGWKYLKSLDLEAIQRVYPSIILVFTSKRNVEAGAWDDDGVIYLQRKIDSWYDILESIEEQNIYSLNINVEEYIKELIIYLRHEMVHMAQQFLAVGVYGEYEDQEWERIPGPGYPSKKIMNRTITQNFLEKKIPKKYRMVLNQLKREGLLHEVHSLDDAEFYSLLINEVEYFKDRYSFIRKKKRRSNKLKIYVGERFVDSETSEWFLTLKRRNPPKWRKAVKEFSKLVLR